MHTLTRHRQSKRAQAQTEKGTGGTGGTDESVLLIHARARRRAGAGAQAGKQGSRQAADLFVQKRLRINIGKQLRRNVALTLLGFLQMGHKTLWSHFICTSQF